MLLCDCLDPLPLSWGVWSSLHARLGEPLAGGRGTLRSAALNSFSMFSYARPAPGRLYQTVGRPGGTPHSPPPRPPPRSPRSASCSASVAGAAGYLIITHSTASKHICTCRGTHLAGRGPPPWAGSRGCPGCPAPAPPPYSPRWPGRPPLLRCRTEAGRRPGCSFFSSLPASSSCPPRPSAPHRSPSPQSVLPSPLQHPC